MFTNSSKFWNWILVSSSDPTKAATTIQGFFSLVVVQGVFNLLPLIGIHPTFTLDLLGTDAYSFVYSALSAISFLIGAYGAVIKIYRSIRGTNLAMASYRSAMAGR